MKKTVIAIRGTGGSGKTSSLKILRDRLLKEYSAVESNYEPVGNKEEDFISYLKLNQVSICITSQGDNAYFMKKPLEAAILAKCNIIICACRSSGGTQKIIQEICSKYNKIWITKNRLNSDNNEVSFRKMANQNSVQLILDIIQTI